MMILVQLAIVAFVISVIVWGVFGYFIAPYLIGHNAAFSARKLGVAPAFYYKNIVASRIVFASPELMIIQPSGQSHATFQLPKNMTANTATVSEYKLAVSTNG